MEWSSLWSLAPFVLVYFICIVAITVHNEEKAAKAREAGLEPPERDGTLAMAHILFITLLLGLTYMLYQEDREDARIAAGLADIRMQSTEAIWVVETMQECMGHFGASATGCAASTMSLAQSRGDRPNTRELIIQWGRVHEDRTGLESDQP